MKHWTQAYKHGIHHNKAKSIHAKHIYQILYIQINKNRGTTYWMKQEKHAQIQTGGTHRGNNK